MRRLAEFFERRPISIAFLDVIEAGINICQSRHVTLCRRSLVDDTALG